MTLQPVLWREKVCSMTGPLLAAKRIDSSSPKVFHVLLKQLNSLLCYV